MLILGRSFLIAALMFTPPTCSASCDLSDEDEEFDEGSSVGAAGEDTASGGSVIGGTLVETGGSGG
jgi:hypothetical protein